jgi:hypothetical protein
MLMIADDAAPGNLSKLQSCVNDAIRKVAVHVSKKRATYSPQRRTSPTADLPPSPGSSVSTNGGGEGGMRQPTVSDETLATAMMHETLLLNQIFESVENLVNSVASAVE